MLAMKPRVLVFDESTSMLDPKGRAEILKVMRELNEYENMTIIHITHNMDEAVPASRLMVMENGKIVLDDMPAAVFSSPLLYQLKLKLPLPTFLAHRIQDKGLPLVGNILTVEQLVDGLEVLL